MKKDNFTYLFSINAKNGKNYYLTSSSSPISYEGNLYLPFSGLSILSAKFDDSAQNKIILQGVFEPLGISQNTDLTGSVIKIIFYEKEQSRDLVTYICTQQTNENLEFQLECQPESIKLNQSLLPVFSRTCRANFCDKDCGLDLEMMKVLINIESIFGEEIIFDNNDEYKSGYFSQGKMLVEYDDGKQKEYFIYNHFKDRLRIKNISEFDNQSINSIYLYPSCDKNIRTCCYSFNNAVNFRGEPDIPENRVIKN